MKRKIPGYYTRTEAEQNLVDADAKQVRSDGPVITRRGLARPIKDDENKDILERSLNLARTANPLFVINADGAHVVPKFTSDFAGTRLSLKFDEAQVLDLMDSQLRTILSPIAVPAGIHEVLSTTLLRTSRVMKAGAKLITMPEKVTAVGAAGALMTQPHQFVTIQPAAFELLQLTDGEGDVPLSESPTQIADVPRDGFSQYAVRFVVSRREQKERGFDQVSAEIMTAIALGVGRVIDKELFRALDMVTMANNLEFFSFGAAAASGVSFEELYAFVGRNGAGVIGSTDGDLPNATGRGLNVHGCIPAQFSADLAETVIGAWSRFAVVVRPEIDVLIRRASIEGKLEVTAFVDAHGLVPSTDFAWLST
jgi:hypothetical protein